MSNWVVLIHMQEELCEKEKALDVDDCFKDIHDTENI
jgi:hypothetical protein